MCRYTIVIDIYIQPIIKIDIVNIIFFFIITKYEFYYSRHERCARKRSEEQSTYKWRILQSGERRVIKERGGRGRARAVLINFFPFLTYIYIYLFLSFYLRFRNLFFRKEREGGRETSRINSISCELSHSIIAILRITRAPFNENLYYLMKRARRVASNRSKTIPCSATKQHHENDF